MDRTEVRLSSLWNERPVVLEFGSITCPIFVGWIDGIDALAESYRGEVDFYVVYSREAHPDESRPAHRTLDEKMRRAEDLIAPENLEPRIEELLGADGVAGAVEPESDVENFTDPRT